MPLRVSTVSRNLNAQIMFFGLEFEDLLIVIVLAVAGMLGGQFFFPDRYVFFLPMNWALFLSVVVTTVPALSLLKYGKPRGYTGALMKWYTTPRAYSGLEPERIQTSPYIRPDGDYEDDDNA